MTKNREAAGRGKNKRKWTTEEVNVTLDFVLELKGDPRWKCEGGFRNGFHQHLEEKLEIFFPGIGLKASQIESKLKFLKEKYISIHEMTKLSGFTWDEGTCMINCEKQAYEDYCKIHPRAAGLWKKPFPEFNKLELIFGEDRATGDAAEDVEDMLNNIDNEFTEEETATEGTDYISSDTGSKRRKVSKSSLGNNSAHAEFADAMKEIKGHLSTIAETMLRSDNRDELVSTQKKMLLSEISMLPGISEMAAVDATRVISRSPSELDAFYSCPNDHWKMLHVQSIIVRLHGSSGAARL